MKRSRLKINKCFKDINQNTIDIRRKHIKSYSELKEDTNSHIPQIPISIDISQISEFKNSINYLHVMGKEAARAISSALPSMISASIEASRALETTKEMIRAAGIAESLKLVQYNYSQIIKSLRPLNYDSSQLELLTKNIGDSLSSVTASLESFNMLRSSFLNIYSDNLQKALSGISFQLKTDYLRGEANLKNLDIDKLYDESMSFDVENIVVSEDGALALGKKLYSIYEIKTIINQALEECEQESEDADSFINNLIKYTCTELPKDVKQIFIGIIVALIMFMCTGQQNTTTNYNIAAQEIKINVSNAINDRVFFDNYRFVGVKSLNLRESGNSSSKLLCRLNFGHVVKIVDFDGNWVYIETTVNEDEPIKGWVYKNYLKTFECEKLETK